MTDSVGWGTERESTVKQHVIITRHDQSIQSSSKVASYILLASWTKVDVSQAFACTRAIRYELSHTSFSDTSLTCSRAAIDSGSMKLWLMRCTFKLSSGEQGNAPWVEDAQVDVGLCTIPIAMGMTAGSYRWTPILFRAWVHFFMAVIQQPLWPSYRWWVWLTILCEIHRILEWIVLHTRWQQAGIYFVKVNQLKILPHLGSQCFKLRAAPAQTTSFS